MSQPQAKLVMWPVLDQHTVNLGECSVEVTPLQHSPDPTVTVAPPPAPEAAAQPQQESQLSFGSKTRVVVEHGLTPSLLASLDGVRARILTHAIPDAEGHVYVHSINAGASHHAVKASRLTLIGLGPG
ncbi:MAG: hypothetical protein KGZ67_08435 [Hydrogenophaga sp.]|nr:hypothetical protein [Hydrogenophaga sp.]